jgi:hypothetical protein
LGVLAGVLVDDEQLCDRNALLFRYEAQGSLRFGRRLR